MRFIDGIRPTGRTVDFTFEGRSYTGHANESIASAMMRAGLTAMRETRQLGEKRGYYCGMGLCWECAVHVNGEGIVRSCSYPITDGQVISFADRKTIDE